VDQNARQELLARLAQRTLGSERYLDNAIAELTQATSEALGVERCSLWLLDADRASLHCVDLYERSKAGHSSGVVLAAASYPNYFAALASGRAIDANDARTDPRTNEFTEGYLVPLGITSMLDATVRRDGVVIGVLCCEHIGDARHWTSEEGLFAAAFADQAALMLAAGERKQLEESEHRYRRLMDAANDAIAISDAAGLVVEANHKLEQLLARPPGSIIGRSLLDFIVPEDREIARECFRTLDTTERARACFRVATGDDRVINVELSTAVVVQGSSRESISIIREMA